MWKSRTNGKGACSGAHPRPKCPAIPRGGPRLLSPPQANILNEHRGVPANALPSSSTFTSTTAMPEPALAQQQTSPSSTGQAEAAEATKDWESEMEELLKLVSLLPPSVRSHIEECPDMPDLLEVVMDLGRPPLARFPTGDVKLGDDVVTAQDLELAISQVGDFGGDNRAGIDRTLHRISCIRNRSGKIIGLTCRVGRAIRGSARLVSDLVLSGSSILFLGRPGVGKTTVIREVSRALADELQKRVVIVDTSNEIGGDGDIPHDGIGRARRIQVPHPDQQHRVMIEAVENHMPQVVVIDEIGTEAECAAAKTIAQRGVQLVATAHGNEIENVIKNPSLADLVGGIQSVTLGDEEARKRGVQKSILERGGPPTFDVAVEMLERNKWRVHLDVAQAVDLLLAGGEPGGQVRERAEDGTIHKYTHDPAVSSTIARPTKVYTSSGSTSTSVKAAKAAAVSTLAVQEELAAAAAAKKGLGGLGMPPGARIVTSSTTTTTTTTTSSRGVMSAGGSKEWEAVPAARRSASPAQEVDAGEQSGSEGGRSRGLLRRSVHASVEAAASEVEASLGEDGVAVQEGAKRLAARQTLIGVQPEEVVLRLFPYELDADKLWEVLSAMELERRVLIVRRVAQADAVLGLRLRIRSDAALRQAAKTARVPIYAIKATGTSSLVRALRTLLGIDPSAGGMFVRTSGGSASQSQSGQSSDGDEAALSPPDVGDSAGKPVHAGSLRAEIDIAAVKHKAAKFSSSSDVSTYSASMVQEALQEARTACEQLVAVLQQPVELLPRPVPVLEAQQRVIDTLGWEWELLGAGTEQRIRVLPRRTGSTV